MKTARHILACTAFGSAPLALADGAQPFAAPAAAAAGASSGAAGLGQVTLALGVVLVAVFAFAWVVRQLRGVGRSRGGTIEVLGDVALGQKERAVLLKVGRAQLLVGVAPGNVRTLHVLAEDGGVSLAPTEVPTTGERGSFRSLLMKGLGR